MDFLASLDMHHRNCFVSEDLNKMSDISKELFPLVNGVTC